MELKIYIGGEKEMEERRDEDRELKEAKAESEERKKAVKAKEQKQVKSIRRLILLLNLLALSVVGIYIFYSDTDMLVLKILSIAILLVSLWICDKFAEFMFGKYEF